MIHHDQYYSNQRCLPPVIKHGLPENPPLFHRSSAINLHFVGGFPKEPRISEARPFQPCRAGALVHMSKPKLIPHSTCVSARNYGESTCKWVKHGKTWWNMVKLHWGSARSVTPSFLVLDLFIYRSLNLRLWDLFKIWMPHKNHPRRKKQIASPTTTWNAYGLQAQSCWRLGQSCPVRKSSNFHTSSTLCITWCKVHPLNKNNSPGSLKYSLKQSRMSMDYLDPCRWRPIYDIPRIPTCVR